MLGRMDNMSPLSAQPSEVGEEVRSLKVIEFCSFDLNSSIPFFGRALDFRANMFPLPITVRPNK
jgi:hypothetical protein